MLLHPSGATMPALDGSLRHTSPMRSKATAQNPPGHEESVILAQRRNSIGGSITRVQVASETTDVNACVKNISRDEILLYQASVKAPLAAPGNWCHSEEAFQHAWRCERRYDTADDVWGKYGSNDDEAGEQLRKSLEQWNVRQTNGGLSIHVDDRLQKTEQEADKYVRKLYDAITDTSHCLLSFKDPVIHQLILGEFPVEKILLVYHNLIGYLVRLHSRYGPRIHMEMNPNYKTGGKARRGGELYTKFEERFENICDALRHNKQLCTDLLDGKTTFEAAVLLAPKSTAKQKVVDWLGNERRAAKARKAKDKNVKTPIGRTQIAEKVFFMYEEDQDEMPGLRADDHLGDANGWHGFSDHEQEGDAGIDNASG